MGQGRMHQPVLSHSELCGGDVDNQGNQGYQAQNNAQSYGYDVAQEKNNGHRHSDARNQQHGRSVRSKSTATAVGGGIIRCKRIITHLAHSFKICLYASTPRFLRRWGILRNLPTIAVQFCKNSQRADKNTLPTRFSPPQNRTKSHFSNPVLDGILVANSQSKERHP